MKKFFLLIITAVLMVISSCKPSPEKAENYYNEIFKQLELVVDKEATMINFINIEMQKSDTTLQKKDTASVKLEIDASFQDFKAQIDKSLYEVEKLPDFNGKTDFRDAAVNLLKEYKSVPSAEYVDAIKIVKIPMSLYTEEDDNMFLKLTETIDDKLQKKIDKYVKILKTFASEYKFEIVTDSIKGN